MDALTVSVSGAPCTSPAPTTVTCRVSALGCSVGPLWESHPATVAVSTAASGDGE